MRVWVVGRNYPLPSNSMQGSFELEQAKMLSEHGMNVTYLACSLHPFKKIKGYGIREWEENEVRICTLSAFLPPRIYPFYFNSLRVAKWKKLFAYIERQSGCPDVIHVHYPAMLMLADLLGEYKQKGVRIVVTEHWTKVLTRRLDKMELGEYCKYANVVDAFICVGKPLAQVVSETIHCDAIVVPNVVNRAFKVSDKQNEQYTFVALGRLTKVKQFDQIIKAFSEEFKDQKIKLVIIGGGEERKKLKSLIADLDIGSQVELTGSLNREKTAKVVSAADSLICYSKLETFGVPIIEAWACGIPVISTTAAAVVDAFDDERLGFEISPDCFDELKQSMVKLYEHRADYDKQFISSFALEMYSEKTVAEKLYQIYQGERL